MQASGTGGGYYPESSQAVAPLLVAGIAAAGSAIGSIGSSAINASSARDVNSQSVENSRYMMERQHQINWAEAGRQMDFQREMSNTAWQRSIADMEKAGINPMLAFDKGPASSPQGASGSVSGSAPSLNVPQYGDAIKNGIQSLLSTGMEVMNFKKDMERKSADIAAVEANAEYSRAQTALSMANAKRVGLELPAIEAEAQARKKHGLYDRDWAPFDAIIDRLRSLIPFTSPRETGGGKSTPKL